VTERLPVNRLERYVTADELAELMGVSRATIGRMTRAGMPSEDWGLKRTRRYLPSQAIEWARKRRDTISPLRVAPTTRVPTTASEGVSFDA
jgi:hypothetical protein